MHRERQNETFAATASDRTFRQSRSRRSGTAPEVLKGLQAHTARFQPTTKSIIPVRQQRARRNVQVPDSTPPSHLPSPGPSRSASRSPTPPQKKRDSYSFSDASESNRLGRPCNMQPSGPRDSRPPQPPSLP